MGSSDLPKIFNELASLTQLARALQSFRHERSASSPTAPNRRFEMTNSANSIFRNLVGMMAALIIGGTFVVAAAGPAVAQTNSVNSVTISNIVRSA
jgi:hypothetical protein